MSKGLTVCCGKVFSAENYSREDCLALLGECETGLDVLQVFKSEAFKIIRNFNEFFDVGSLVL